MTPTCRTQTAMVPLAILECLLNDERLDVRDLLSLRRTCKQLADRLTGKLPPYLRYRLSEAHSHAVVSCSQAFEAVSPTVEASSLGLLQRIVK